MLTFFYSGQVKQGAHHHQLNHLVPNPQIPAVVLLLTVVVIVQLLLVVLLLLQVVLAQVLQVQNNKFK